MAALRTLLLATVLAAPGAAFAQTQPAPQPQPQAEDQEAADEQADDEAASSEVEGVQITAERSQTRTSIDSISYSMADDLQAATGSLADALRNVPSVDVDIQGNVSLRGDANVTILIDGRPSALLDGPGRGQAILQMPAEQFSRIEVMTNPSAAYRPDGSGGVINLITRPNVTRAGSSYNGSVRANVGMDGRYNLGVSGAYTHDRLTLTGDVGVRHDVQDMVFDTVRRRLDTLSTLTTESRQHNDIAAETDSHYVRLVAEYRLDDTTQITGELRRQVFESFGDGLERSEIDVAGGGGLASVFERQGTGGFSGEFSGATARLLRQFGEEHEWTTEIRYDAGDQNNGQDGIITWILPAGAPLYESVLNDRDFTQINLSSTYTRPLGEASKLRAGYEGSIVDLDMDNRVARGLAPGALVEDPTVTNRFQSEQTVHALFATYERPFGDLSAQFGLRAEYVTLDLNQVTTGVTVSNDYFRLYPTLHVEYTLNEQQDLRGSYSRRVQRPQVSDLNPFRSYSDPFNVRSGNPDLEPQVTDSYELSWLRRANQTFQQVTLYYRDTSDAFTNVVVDLGGGVLLTQPVNLGSSQSIGVEAVANGRLHPTLRYNASVNAFHQSIDASNLGFADADGTTVTARVSLNWQPTPEDFVQVGGFWSGEQIFAQGRREASGMINVGYRRTLTPSLALQFTVRDVFDSFQDEVIYDTPGLYERTERRFGGRTAFIGLTWTFGQQRPGQQQPAFDFSGPQTGS